jgi:hypothetical protein
MTRQIIKHEQLAALYGLSHELIAKCYRPKSFQRKVDLRAPKTYALLMKFTAEIRKISKKHANTTIKNFTAVRGGSASFDYWKRGFEFASSLSEETNVSYFYFDSINEAVFFYTSISMAAIEFAIKEFYVELRQIENTFDVELVHVS